MLTYDVTPYNREAHEGFVRVSWCKGAREPWDALAQRLRRPDVRCLVAHIPGAPDDLLGWAAVDLSQGAVIWAYVRDLYGKVRRRGLGTSLLLDCGLDVSDPTPCLYWSPAAAAIAARGGYRLFYQPRTNPMRRAA